MTTYYVGPGGNDGWSGTSWAHRLLTLNGAEDKPVAAGDTVYVGPGVYRELLTVDVSGVAGSPITYIGDVSGENTDGVGGIVRITGSDNDQSATRLRCINADGKSYRTFRGFTMDTVTGDLIRAIGSPTNWIIEDCTFTNMALNNRGVEVVGDSQSAMTIRRCWFTTGSGSYSIRFSSSAGVQNAGHVVENCFFLAAFGRGIDWDDVGGTVVRNCTLVGGFAGFRVTDALPGGYTANTVYNCILYNASTAVQAVNLGEIVEDYNTFYNNVTNRTNVNVGGNSLTYPPLLRMPVLHAGASQASGFRYPWWFGELSEWSQVNAVTNVRGTDEDLWGIQRPIRRNKRSWGSYQFQDIERDTLTTRGASAASLVVHEPGRVQMWVPTSNVQTTISTYVYRLAGYSSITNPQMVIKQPGQTDRTTTDAAAASQWNLLSDTFTPAADPPYVIVELVSNEGATSTSTSITSTSTSVTSTSTTTTLTSTSTTSTSISTSTTTLGYNVYFDDLSVS